MARRPDPSHKRRIVDAAWKALRQNGSGKLSMAAIAKEVGIDRSSLYWHFKDRSALMWALIERLIIDQVAHVRSQLVSIDDPLERLRLHTFATVEFFQTRAQDLVHILRLAANTKHIAENTMRRIGAMNKSFRDELLAGLEAGQRRGEIKKMDASLILHSSRAVMDGVIIQMITEGRAPLETLNFFYQQTIEPLRITGPKDQPTTQKDRNKPWTTLN